ncbi:MAG: MBL fold metallo-hydrolase, partial [Bdellovibrionota bacterium]
MQIGPYTVTSLVFDHFRLDGGAMFGVVPKPLWERRIPGDSQNRIQLASRVLLIEGAGRKILVDIGCGSKYTPKQTDIYVFVPQVSPAPEVQFADVTDIILTHLHFDH